MRILYVLGDVPARGTGGHTRAASTIRALARSGEVDVMWSERPALDADPALAEIERVTLLAVEGRGVGGRLSSAVRELAALHPVALALAVKPALVDAVARRSSGADVVIADQLVAAVTCLRAGTPSKARSVYNANNLEWRLRASGGVAQRIRWAGARRLERQVLTCFSQAWMVSEPDRAGALALCPSADVRVVPNALDVGEIRPVKQLAEAPVVLLVGSFDYEPNRIGLRWLASDVMPLVWARRPDVRLRVVGRWPTRPWRPPDERVELAGFVPDLRAEYEGARCAVAPLLVGGGTPLKVVEALAYGVPLVATRTAVAALSRIEPGRHVIAADEAAEFADGLVTVLDPAYVHGERGADARTVIERNYSVDTIAGDIADALSA